MRKIKPDLHLAAVVIFSLLIFIMSLRVTMYRYRNYEYGKFDLGNMSQMVYNSLHGHFMEVTDYFGANMPRWGMSHFDPLLLIFVPVYAVFPDARVLIVGQLVLLISSSLLLYLIGKRVVQSKPVAFLIAASFLFY